MREGALFQKKEEEEIRRSVNGTARHRANTSLYRAVTSCYRSTAQNDELKCSFHSSFARSGAAQEMHCLHFRVQPPSTSEPDSPDVRLTSRLSQESQYLASILTDRHLSHHKLCTRGMELAPEVDFYLISTFTEGACVRARNV